VSGTILTLIVISFIFCAKETLFRESALALVAWPEIASWITALFLYTDEIVPFLLVLAALLFHIILNIYYGLQH